jgi:4-amino-4-deoxychorismate lyase
MSDGRPDKVLLNGVISSEPWLLDRGLHFGDGLFETISCRSGRPRFIDLHMERLADGCRRLQLSPLNLDEPRARVLQLAAEVESCIIKLIVTRGEALARGYSFTGQERPNCALLRYPWPEERVPEVFGVGLAMLRLGENSALAGLKHLNRLEQVLASKERTERGLDELLMMSRSGHLVSGILSNLFVVQEGVLLTPLLDQCGVAGIMRRVVMREARRHKLPCEERVIEAGELDRAREAFLTNSRLGVVPVVQVDGRQREVGPVTRRIQALIAPMLENPVDG